MKEFNHNISYRTIKRSKSKIKHEEKVNFKKKNVSSDLSRSKQRKKVLLDESVQYTMCISSIAPSALLALVFGGGSIATGEADRINKVNRLAVIGLNLTP